MILNSLVSSLIRPFIGQKGDWIIIKQSSLTKKLQAINGGWQSAYILYLYTNLAYSIIYKIMRPYKNYLSRPYTLIQNQFNKIILYLQIIIEYGFTIYQNL